MKDIAHLSGGPFLLSLNGGEQKDVAHLPGYLGLLCGFTAKYQKNVDIKIAVPPQNQ